MARPKVFTDEELRAHRLAYQERYRQTENYRQSQAKYATSDKRRATSARQYKKMREKAPIKTRAYLMVYQALQAGLIEKPRECAGCGRETRLYGHHYLGYEPKHWLDLVWLCARCHKAAHD